MTNIDFGPVILGGNTFGWTSDKEQSFAVLDAFVDHGGLSIDTADVYSAWVPGNSGGESETILGEWFASRPGVRDKVSVATKVFSLEARPGLSPANIRAAVDDSLGRLQTDRIDLYYAHRDDPEVAQEDVVAVFEELVQAGKIREAGASNFTPDRLRSAVAIAKQQGVTGFTVSQDHYNLVERDAEAEMLPAIHELGLVEAPYYSLASGFLTGKYRPGAQVDSARAGSAAAYLESDANRQLLEVLDTVAASHEVSVAAVSLAWLRQQPAVAAPIASARTPEHLGAMFESARVQLSTAELEALSAPTA